jgi:Cohesin domain
VNAGGTLDININIGQVTSLNSYQFDLAYDSSVIQVIGDEGAAGVTQGLIGSTPVPVGLWAFQPVGTPTSGHIEALFTLSTKTATGQGYLAQIHFKVIGSAGKVSSLALSKVILFNLDGTRMQFSTQNGSVTVQ